MRHTTRRLHGLLVASAAALVGCVAPNPNFGTTEETTGTTRGESEATTQGTTVGTSSSTTDPSTGEETTESSSSSTGYETESETETGTTGVRPYECGECDPYDSNCPDGMKCTVEFDPEDRECGGVSQCVPGGVGKQGDTCDMLPEGDDTCGPGLVCVVDKCMLLCENDRDCSLGNQPFCFEEINDSFINLCSGVCDPLETDPPPCAMGDVCVPNPNNEPPFICFPDASGGTGFDGVPCTSANTCSPPHVCVDSEMLGGWCMAGACCTKFCDTDLIGQCMPGLLCVPWYAVNPPPEYADLGVCIQPQP